MIQVRALVTLVGAIALASCGSMEHRSVSLSPPPVADTAAPPPTLATLPPPVSLQCPNVASINSPSGQKWTAEEGWRYATSNASEAGYIALLKGANPWPDWFVPEKTVLTVGTRFQMAMAPGQPETSPGGFGTFDMIWDAQDVRYFLAVRYDWKPKIDRVVTFEVTQPLPANVGPVGPQIDPHDCGWLPGRWSQLQMLVNASDRMNYIKVINVRMIH